MNSRLRDVLKMVLFLAIGTAILWFLYRSLDASYQEECVQRGIATTDCSLWKKLLADLRSANVFWLAVIVICFFISNVSRALRWQQLIRSLGHQTRPINAFLTTMLGYFANLGFPRLGEFVRAGSFARYEHIPFEKVMGTVIVGRAVDLLCFAVVFFLGFLLQGDILWNYLSSYTDSSITQIFQSVWLYIVGAAMMATSFLLYKNWDGLKQYALISKIDGLIRGFIDGLKSIAKVERMSIFILYTLVIWFMYYCMTFLCFKAFEPTASLGPYAGLLVFVFGTIGMLIPSPGGMGSYHALVIAGLLLYGIRPDDAFSFAMIIFFTINIFGNIIFGIIALLYLPGYNARYQPMRTAHAGGD